MARTKTTTQLLDTVIAHDEAQDRPAAVLEQAYLLLALHLEYEAMTARTPDVARAKQYRADDSRRRARRLEVARRCEYCDDEGLCDDGSYNRVACECPAGQDLADAEMSARDSVADHSRRLGLGSSVRWV